MEVETDSIQTPKPILNESKRIMLHENFPLTNQVLYVMLAIHYFEEKWADELESKTKEPLENFVEDMMKTVKKYITDGIIDPDIRKIKKWAKEKYKIGNTE